MCFNFFLRTEDIVNIRYIYTSFFPKTWFVFLSSIGYLLIAVVKHHVQGNLGKKKISFGFESLSGLEMMREQAGRPAAEDSHLDPQRGSRES